MLNKAIYQTDPSTQKLVNEGVANVNDARTPEAMDVLRYELQTFVCDGQYKAGLEHILETYLRNISESQQSAVWISGFFGSGKSHLVKMLRALWENTPFEDGATSRGIAQLPQGIRDQLKELDIQGKQHGGLCAASGTLSSGVANSVRLALLGIVFKAVGLPEQYHLARFVMWLKSEGIYEQVRQDVEKHGGNWEEELDNLLVAEGLREALVRVKPNLFASTQSCNDVLVQSYPYVQDVSSDDMVKAIKQAVSRNSKFPLTLIVLDEIQQYIGQNSQKSLDVQEAVEACCKKLGGKLLFIGTGQTAITGTSNLKRLEGRFTTRIELSDADVDAVVRKVILAKKPETKQAIEGVMAENIGEISRHLSDTTLAHRNEDRHFFYWDYPLLPTRRRFWENVLRALDRTGTDSQLRNQLHMVHKVVQTNLDQPLGHVVAADFLYFESAGSLMQTRILPKKVYEKTSTWKQQGTEDDKLMARACGLVFLINKLDASNPEIGIKATLDTLADLLVEDLHAGSSELRARLSKLLDSCEILMKVNDEYRIQTEESTVWNDDFQNQVLRLANESHRIDTERDDRLRKKFGEIIGKKLSLTQGSSKVNRNILLYFDQKLPADAKKHLYVWVRNGWETDEATVQAEACQAGKDSSTIFVFIPKHNSDGLRDNLIQNKAASMTLEIRGTPSTAEGIEAKAAMETTRQRVEKGIQEILDHVFSGARVFQGGGQEIVGNDIQATILEAAENSLTRLYPKFSIADHTGWSKVYENAKKGVPDALKSVRETGEVVANAVCKTVLAFIASGKKGSDIRKFFESSPYGWSGDAVDGALQVLLIAGQIRALDERGQPIDPLNLDRKSLGKSTFKTESTTVSAAQILQIRKLMQKLKISAKPKEVLQNVPAFLNKMQDLAKRAGGEEPKPIPPDTKILDEIRQTSGNEQLVVLDGNSEELTKNIDDWSELAKKIEQAWPNWESLERLAAYATNVKDADIIILQIQAVRQQRQLLDDPSPVDTLLSHLTQLLREELNRLDSQYNGVFDERFNHLVDDKNWSQIEQEDRDRLLSEESLRSSDRPNINVESPQSVLQTLDQCNLQALADRVAALPKRFQNLATKAAKLCEPKAQLFSVSGTTLKTEEEIDAWISDLKQQLKTVLRQGPVVIQ